MRFLITHATLPTLWLVSSVVAQSRDRGDGSNPFLDAFQWIGQILLWPLVVVLAAAVVWFVASRLRRRP